MSSASSGEIRRATWDIDPVAVGRLGLTVTQVSEQLSDAWLGDVQTELRLSDRAIPVRVRYPDAYRFDPQQMAATPIRAADGKTVALGTVAHATTTEGEIILQRENLRQMALVTGRLEDRDLGSAVAEIQTKLRDLKLPVGYTTEVGGQYASQRQSFRELLTVFAIAAALVFVILLFQFGRFLPALLILAAAPLSLVGRVRAAAVDRHRPERLVGDGLDPARRTGREERNRAARLRASPARRRDTRSPRHWRSPAGCGSGQS